jgi:hypothetical protein
MKILSEAKRLFSAIVSLLGINHIIKYKFREKLAHFEKTIDKSKQYGAFSHFCAKITRL